MKAPDKDKLLHSGTPTGSSQLPAWHKEDEMTSVKTVFLVLSLLLSAGLVSSASSAELDATIFSYDGQDFVRTDTTLMKDGASAADTKLDRDSPA